VQYYLGVAQQLQELGILQDSTQLAGASAGSLIVACIKSGLPFDTIQAACFELARCVTVAVCLACGSCSVSHGSNLAWQRTHMHKVFLQQCTCAHQTKSFLHASRGF
jgi:hypothetical protein